MSLPEENTQSRAAARRALIESQQSSRQADRLIAQSREAIDQVRQVRQTNHFADKFRSIIRGAA